jgi:hypothetical protein
MRQDLTDVTLVVDRSGSMAVVQAEAESGINHFIESQRKQEGECLLSLIQFDTEYEFVHQAVPISQVGHYTLSPRGMTALLDAVGRGVNETGERLAALEEGDRPGLVVFVIVTDGKENSSQEFSKSQIKEMIERQQGEYSWKFTFLGANQDAFAEAAGMGIRADGTADFDDGKIGQAYETAGKLVSRMRMSVARGEAVACCYSDQERRSLKG